MHNFHRLSILSAFAFVALGVILTLTIIVAIWGEFGSKTLWKTIGTLFVLFVFSGFLHAVSKAMCEKPGGKN
jgi:hypothetical protein